MDKTWQDLTDNKLVKLTAAKGVEVIQFVTDRPPFSDDAEPGEIVTGSGYIAWCAKSPRKVKLVRTVRLSTTYKEDRIEWDRSDLGRGEVGKNNELEQSIDASSEFSNMSNSEFLKLATKFQIKGEGPCRLVTRCKIGRSASSEMASQIRTRLVRTDDKQSERDDSDPLGPITDLITLVTDFIAKELFHATFLNELWTELARHHGDQLQELMNSADKPISRELIESFVDTSEDEHEIQLTEIVFAMNCVIDRFPDRLSELEPSVWHCRIPASEGMLIPLPPGELLRVLVKLGEAHPNAVVETLNDVGVHGDQSHPAFAVRTYVNSLPQRERTETVHVLETLARRIPNSPFLQAATNYLRMEQ